MGDSRQDGWAASLMETALADEDAARISSETAANTMRAVLEGVQHLDRGNGRKKDASGLVLTRCGRLVPLSFIGWRVGWVPSFSLCAACQCGG